jgi:hypothetical protein
MLILKIPIVLRLPKSLITQWLHTKRQSLTVAGAAWALHHFAIEMMRTYFPVSPSLQTRKPST